MFTSPWLSRAAALLLLALLLAILQGWVVAPLLAAGRERAQALADGEQLLRRLERVAAERQALRAERDALLAEPLQAQDYLAGETEALAAAALQARVAGLVQAQGGQLASVQPIPGQASSVQASSVQARSVQASSGQHAAGRQDDAQSRLGLRLQLQATVPRLLAILYGIEAGRPLLFIDSLDLQAQMAEANPGAGLEPEPILTVGLDLHGYRLPAPPAAAGKAP